MFMVTLGKLFYVRSRFCLETYNAIKACNDFHSKFINNQINGLYTQNTNILIRKKQ